MFFPEIGPASVMVGNLVSGKRIAQASGRDLGQIEDNDQARKVSARPGCSPSPVPTGCCVMGCQSRVYRGPLVSCPLGPADTLYHLTRKMHLLGLGIRWYLLLLFPPALI